MIIYSSTVHARAIIRIPYYNIHRFSERVVLVRVCVLCVHVCVHPSHYFLYNNAASVTVHGAQYCFWSDFTKYRSGFLFGRVRMYVVMEKKAKKKH